MKISIITPSFNQGKFIERTIQSVLSQNYPNLEYIIIDGGSTDNTLEILKNYKERIIYISEPDKGQADAVNKGLKMCTGEIIGWINSDDTYNTDTFRIINDYFVKNKNIDIVYGVCNYIDEFDNYVGCQKLVPYNYKILVNDWCYIPQPTVFFKKKLLFDIGYLDISIDYSMDYEFWCRIGKKYNIGYIKEKIANFRIYINSKSFEFSTRQAKENFLVHMKYGTKHPIFFFFNLILILSKKLLLKILGIKYYPSFLKKYITDLDEKYYKKS